MNNCTTTQGSRKRVEFPATIMNIHSWIRNYPECAEVAHVLQ